MKKTRYRNRYNALIAALLSALLLLFSACETEKEVIRTVEVIVRDTIVVSIISVDSIFAVPDSITQGGEITLQADVTQRTSSGDLQFSWFATAGSFDAPTGETVVWTAPDDPGAYTISVHADDGSNIGIGSRVIGVGMYAPTTNPFFIADISCMQCHPGEHGEWAETGHAEAWATLQESGNPQEFCNRCHSIGYDPEPFSGNGGYDEAPIEKFVNVQCESCHGAGSDHISGPAPDPEQIHISYSAEDCGNCHDGTHHPFLTEWQDSPHGFDPATRFAAANGSCQGCHEGVGAAERLSGDLSSFYGGGSVGRPDTSAFALEPIACATCHDPHNHDNPGQLRTVADVPLVTANDESPVITLGGVGKLCMHCHHARRAPEGQIENGYAHFGPHANPQADMMAGKSAYHDVAEPDFVWATPSHLAVQNSCKTCHLNTVEFGGGPDGAAVTGHSFLATVEACANCHGAIADFDDIPALEDFDGDGSVEGVQSEVNGLMATLEEDLYASILGRGVDTTGLELADILGDTTLSTFVEREAGYNWAFVHDDKSHGVHNPDYCVQLLQQSIAHLTGADLPNAVILRDGMKAVPANW